MATALDFIRRAMRLIGSLDAGEIPSAVDAQTGLEALQAMLGEWETRGVRLGGVVDMPIAAATVIPVPVTHLNAIAYGLAAQIAPEYGKPPDVLQPIVAQAERSFKALLGQYTRAPTIGADPAVVWQRGILGNVLYGQVANSGDGALSSDTGPIYP